MYTIKEAKEQLNSIQKELFLLQKEKEQLESELGIAQQELA